MAAPSRSRRPLADPRPQRVEKAASPEAPSDPDGGAGRIHDLLTAAVEEAARLLDADGAMVYLTDPTTGRLRFAHDAGIKSARSREWIRTIELAPGVGMFGRAVAERSVVLTTDYGSDDSFRHAKNADRVVDDLGIRSMVVAPMILGDEVVGALGTFSRRGDAFDGAQIALVRSLADHAASAMANSRLIEELDRSRDAERTLRDIAARVSAMRDKDEILQAVIDAATRLLRSSGAMIDLLDAEKTMVGDWTYRSPADAAAEANADGDWEDSELEPDVGVSGLAIRTREMQWTGDYQHDERFIHTEQRDAYVAAMNIRSVIAAPLLERGDVLGAITVVSDRPDAYDEQDAAVLEGLADHAAI
jgi:GAF domain-containing protein